MKKILSFVFISFMITAVFAQTKLTDSDLSLIKDIQNIRLEARTFESGNEAAVFIEDSYAKIKKSSVYSALTEEMKITVDNLLINADYNCLYEADPSNPELKTMMVSQYEVINTFREKHPKTVFNDYFYVSSGDLINSTMQFLAQSHAIKLGLQEKDDYDQLIKRNPSFSFGFINTALWYYFAPSIGGGSTKKAKEYFYNAVQSASDNFEKFYSYIYYSQILYSEKDSNGSEDYLSKALNIVPQSRYITFIKMLNQNGYSLFDYTSNREKVDKKLGLR